MAGRLLSFKDYVGGADNVQVIEMTPSTQRTFRYDYGANVSSYTFEADMQTIVVDTLAYDTATGDPNFTTSNISGSFANSEIGSANISNVGAATGIIKFTIPANRYLQSSGRSSADISFNTTEGHRWAILERFEPDVVIGDPTLDSGYTAIPTS